MIARKSAPQKAANDIAMEYLLEHGANTPEIPVYEIAKEKFGIVVINVPDLPGEVSGVLRVDDDLSTATILVNESHSLQRRRFSVAHELGHYVLHRSRGTHIDDDNRTFFRDRDSQGAVFPREIEANRFAAELLMPTVMVRKELKERLETASAADPVEALAAAFNVSVTAMSLKLQNLGYVL